LGFPKAEEAMERNVIEINIILFIKKVSLLN